MSASRLAVLAGVLLALAASVPASAQDAPPAGAELDDLTAKVAAQLRCPVCRNQSVLESSSTLAREMQAEIRRRLARGESPEQVKSYFVSRYGEWILLEPPPHGINLLVYLLPAAGLLLGGWLVVHLVTQWTGAPEPETGEGGEPGTGEGGTGLSPEEERRLREAMERETGTS